MAKQLDVSKANKTQLAEYLSKKLTKEDLQTVAQHVQDGTFNTEMLRGGVSDTPQPQSVVVDPAGSQSGVTPADTTANLNAGVNDQGNAY